MLLLKLYCNSSRTNQDNCFDRGAGDGEAKVFISVKAEENFHRVLLRRGWPASLEDLFRVVDDLLQDTIDGVTNALEVHAYAREEDKNPRETREELRDGEAGAVDEPVLDGRHEVFGFAALHAERPAAPVSSTRLRTSSSRMSL